MVARISGYRKLYKERIAFGLYSARIRLAYRPKLDSKDIFNLPFINSITLKFKPMTFGLEGQVKIKHQHNSHFIRLLLTLGTVSRIPFGFLTLR